MPSLAIDIGNTLIKLGLFEKKVLVFSKKVVADTFGICLDHIVKYYGIEDCIVCATGNPDKVVTSLTKRGLSFNVLDQDTPVPFKNLYDSPETLGLDRRALVVAAVMNYPAKNVLIVDLGTCVTYDYKNENEEYLGGAISPGIPMRFRALNEFTYRLPLIGPALDVNLIGKNTSHSIQSGVVNGLREEIMGTIARYKKEFGSVEVVLTGGDVQFLPSSLKNGIFAHSNFLLEGLNHIMAFNLNR